MNWNFFKRFKKQEQKPKKLTPIASYDELPDIPVFRDYKNSIEIAARHKSLFASMMTDFRAHYGNMILKIGDATSKKWMKTHLDHLGYEDELHEAANVINGSGAYVLNLSNEFACTSAIVNEPDGTPALYRAFDWPVPGMGDKAVILKRQGKAGHFWDVTYPAMVGTIHAMAPQRFAIAINRAPIPVTFKLPKLLQPLTKPIDKWAWRIKSYRAKGASAPLLLRKVFEECANYDEAVKMLSETKLAAPVIFTICGTQKGQACVIERDREAAVLHEGEKAVTANHWQTDQYGAAHPRPVKSHERIACMKNVMISSEAKAHFGWAKDPLINDFTRLACELSPAKELVRVVGVEPNAQQVTKKMYLRLP
jgi:hypothetical protein